MTGMHLENGAHTTVGRRKNNEDCYCALPELHLFAVADGLGGQAGGEVASALAIATTCDVVGGARPPDDPDTLFQVARDVARAADDRIRAAQEGELSSMATTLAMLLVQEEHAVVAHVGDSRVYRLSHGKLQRLTRDHSLYEELLRSEGTPPQPELANVLLRCLGSRQERSEPDVTVFPVAPGDAFLLCTDGLSGAVTESSIESALHQERLDDACRSLIDQAYAAGSRDNITAVAVRLAGDPAPAGRD